MVVSLGDCCDRSRTRDCRKAAQFFLRVEDRQPIFERDGAEEKIGPVDIPFHERTSQPSFDRTQTWVRMAGQRKEPRQCNLQEGYGIGGGPSGEDEDGFFPE